jgi:Fe-S oxidoreductase
MAYTHELVAECLQDEPAFCTAECPFNLDIRDFIGKLKQGRFNVAYKTYQNAVGFPGIVSALCPEPCKNVCALKNSGGSISIRLLEKASIDYARNSDPDQYNVPAKEKSIAIIGGGISGLACALRLTTKKYKVTLFEKTSSPGGHLLELPERDLCIADIKKQFSHEELTLITDTEIQSLDGLKFDACYIATGKGGNNFGFTSAREGVFTGGSLIGADTMQAIAQGLNASTVIERFLKTGRTNEAETANGTRLTPDAVRITDTKPVLPAEGSSYTKEEAMEEAKRCIRCTCDACVYYSPLLNYFQKFPRRITEEVQVTINPSTLDGAGTVATRLISTCNHCGLCKEVCPMDIDTGEFLLDSHRAMREKGAMPWAFHEFYLRDMDFSNGEAALLKTAPGKNKSKFMFFPGCQLGASDPDYVTKSYRFLLEHLPETALMLGCCGAPAEWAGDVPVHREVIAKIRKDWEALGKPEAILACPTCMQMFRQYLPEIKCRFIYELFVEKGLKPVSSFKGIKASVFDPCASRNEPELQQTIRKLAMKAGIVIEPLPMEGRMAECCSFGGQVAIAHPPYAENMVGIRISQNNNPFIAYCSNCRDIFASAGKETWHILDVYFGTGERDRKGPELTSRRTNRIELKENLLREIWKEKVEMNIKRSKLIVSAPLREKLNKGMILESDLLDVIEQCEASGSKLLDPGKGTFSGHKMIGNMTFWVEYRINPENDFELLNGYCHRMKIEEA